MAETHLTITFGGFNPEAALEAFTAWYLDGGGDYNFREFLEMHDMTMVDSDWTDTSLHFEIEEVEYDEDEDL